MAIVFADGGVRATLSGPEAFFVVLANCVQFGHGRLRSLEQILGDPQLPPSIFQNVFDFDPWMHGCKICLAIFSEAQHGFGSDHRRWPTTRQADTLAPAWTIPVAWTGTKRNPLRKALLAVFEQNYKPMCE